MGSEHPEREGRSLRPPEWYEENPHAKISFSRLAVFRRCPAWYRHQYVEWHKAWSPAVTRAGHAVQEAFEEAIHVEPDGVGDDARELLRWTSGVAATVFPPHWESARRAHEEDPNAVGSWDLEQDRYLSYLRTALRFHVEEALARFELRHPRTGRALDLPPLADLTEAWNAVRPWHVEGAEPLAGMETVPGGFFQGQYDLVYEWTGGRRIVDLKASGGGSPFSTEIEIQLLAYAYLERSLGRGRPEGLEAWFLGKSAPDVFAVPEDTALDAFENEVLRLVERSGYHRGFGQWRPQDFPVQPSTPEGHRAAPGDASAWCAFCPAAVVCPKASALPPSAEPGIRFDAPQSQGPVALRGLVMGVGLPTRRRDKETRRFTLANATGVRSFTWERPVVDELIQEGLRAGNVVLIEGVNPWRHPRSGDVLLFPTARTRLRVEV